MSELVTLEEAKLFLRVQHGLEDSLIQALLNAAVDSAANYTGLQLEQKEFSEKITVASPSSEYIHELSRTPAASVVSFQSNNNGTLSAHTVGELWSYGDRSKLQFDSGELSAFVVKYVAGYTAETLPASIRQAVLFLLGHFYENRVAASAVKTYTTPLAFNALLDPHRVNLFA